MGIIIRTGCYNWEGSLGWLQRGCGRIGMGSGKGKCHLRREEARQAYFFPKGFSHLVHIQPKFLSAYGQASGWASLSSFSRSLTTHDVRSACVPISIPWSPKQRLDWGVFSPSEFLFPQKNSFFCDSSREFPPPFWVFSPPPPPRAHWFVDARNVFFSLRAGGFGDASLRFFGGLVSAGRGC